MDCTHANRCFLAFSGENSDVNFEGTVLVWPHLSLLHISRVFSSYHSQCGRRNNTRNPKGFAGSMAQEEASPCLQNTLKQRKFCCFCVEGKMGGHALPNLVGNVFFFKKKKTWFGHARDGWRLWFYDWGGGGVTQLNSSHEVPKWCPHSMKYRIPTRLSISIDEQMVSSLILWLTLHTNIFMKKKKNKRGK